jgi:glycosyltransferase involved in cell wall biosynthesis
VLAHINGADQPIGPVPFVPLPCASTCRCSIHSAVSAHAVTREQPTVSIIINNYNYARFLAPCIESALGQSYPKTEVIVVDDGSTDESRSIIGRYDGRIEPVLKPNGGQATAINAGFEHAHGELVMFLDSDDVLLPSTAERVVRRFTADPSLSKIQYPMEIIDADGRLTGEIKPALHLVRLEGDVRQLELNSPFDMTWAAMSGNAFATRALREILPMPIDAYAPTGCDMYLAHLAPFYGPVAFFDEVGAYYRVHGANAYASSHLDLKLVRHGTKIMARTLEYIRQTAVRQGLLNATSPPREVLSFAYIAHRLISLKLDPARHPIAEDRMPHLIRIGVAAIRARSDVITSVKFAMLLWLLGVSLGPRPLARTLAEQMLFPERRSARLNQVLGYAHRRRQEWPSALSEPEPHWPAAT